MARTYRYVNAPFRVFDRNWRKLFKRHRDGNTIVHDGITTTCGVDKKLFKRQSNKALRQKARRELRKLEE